MGTRAAGECFHSFFEFFQTRKGGLIFLQTQKTALTTFQNAEKRVENTTRSGEFLTYFEVLQFGNVVKHGLSFLIHYFVVIITCSQANKTGAVASPSLRSAAVGFPISPSLAMKSRISSTTYSTSRDTLKNIKCFL